MSPNNTWRWHLRLFWADPVNRWTIYITTIGLALTILIKG